VAQPPRAPTFPAARCPRELRHEAGRRRAAARHLLLACAPAQTTTDQKGKEDAVRRLTDEEKLTLIAVSRPNYAKVKAFLRTRRRPAIQR